MAVVRSLVRFGTHTSRFFILILEVRHPLPRSSMSECQHVSQSHSKKAVVWRVPGVDQLGGPSLCGSSRVSPAPSLARTHPFLNCGERKEIKGGFIFHQSQPTNTRWRERGKDCEQFSQRLWPLRDPGMRSRPHLCRVIFKHALHIITHSPPPPPSSSTSECFMTQSLGLFCVA